MKGGNVDLLDVDHPLYPHLVYLDKPRDYPIMDKRVFSMLYYKHWRVLHPLFGIWNGLFMYISMKNWYLVIMNMIQGVVLIDQFMIMNINMNMKTMNMKTINMTMNMESWIKTQIQYQDPIYHHRQSLRQRRHQPQHLHHLLQMHRYHHHHGMWHHF